MGACTSRDDFPLTDIKDLPRSLPLSPQLVRKSKSVFRILRAKEHLVSPRNPLQPGSRIEYKVLELSKLAASKEPGKALAALTLIGFFYDQRHGTGIRVREDATGKEVAVATLSWTDNPSSIKPPRVPVWNVYSDQPPYEGARQDPDPNAPLPYLYARVQGMDILSVNTYCAVEPPNQQNYYQNGTSAASEDITNGDIPDLDNLLAKLSDLEGRVGSLEKGKSSNGVDSFDGQDVKAVREERQALEREIAEVLKRQKDAQAKQVKFKADQIPQYPPKNSPRTTPRGSAKGVTQQAYVMRTVGCFLTNGNIRDLVIHALDHRGEVIDQAVAYAEATAVEILKKQLSPDHEDSVQYDMEVAGGIDPAFVALLVTIKAWDVGNMTWSSESIMTAV